MGLLDKGIVGGSSKFHVSNDGVVVWRLSTEPQYVADLLAKSAGAELTEVELRSTLKVNDGFVYLEVPEALIDGFFKLIPGRGLDKPEVASDKKEYVGAHISVMYPEEYEKIVKRRKKLREVGEDFSYTVDRLYSTTPENWDDVKEVFFLTVKSPELEALRKKYGLSKKLNGHDFHITLAVRRRK
jgi:hypothetical protein